MPDSLDQASFEAIFVELHGKIMVLLESNERALGESPVLVEAQTIIRIAEEMFLEGKSYTAVHLLGEAEDLLRRAP